MLKVEVDRIAQKHPEVWIELVPIKRRRMKCSGCDRLVGAVHDYVERWLRNLPVFDAATHLLVILSYFRPIRT
jgi:hypothetical protein